MARPGRRRRAHPDGGRRGTASPGWRTDEHTYRCPALALKVYQRAIAVDPQFSWPYSNIGQVYVEQQDLPQARDWFLKAVNVNPNHWRAQWNLGWVAFNLKRYDESLVAFRRAVALNPTDASGHSNLGRLLLTLNKEEEGRHELELAVRLNPSLETDRAILEGRAQRGS